MSDLATIVTNSWETFKKGLNVYIIIQAFVSLIGVAIGVIAMFLGFFAGMVSPFLMTLNELEFENDLISTIIIVLAVMLIGLLIIGFFALIMIVGAISQGAMIHAIDDVAKKSKSVKDYKYYLKIGYDKKWSVLSLMIIQTLCILAGMIFFIIPGLIISLLLSLSVFPRVLKGKSIKESLKESYELVMSNFWSILGKFVLFTLFSSALSMGSGFIPLGNVLIQLFMGIAWTVILYTIYKDLKK